jgi:hypothetical protein
VLEHLEFHDVLVPLDPVVHLALFDVAHAVVDVLEAAGVGLVVVVDRAGAVAEGGHEQVGIRVLLDVGQGVDPRAAHEGMDRTPVGVDGGDGDGALVVLERAGLLGGAGAVAHRALPGLLGVEDGEGDVLDAVAVLLDLLGGGVVLGQRGRQQQADVALGEQVVGLLAAAGGEVGDLGDVEPEGVGVEVGRLLGVADIEADVVDVDERKRIGGCLGHLGRGGGHLSNLRSVLGRWMVSERTSLRKEGRPDRAAGAQVPRPWSHGVIVPHR